METAVSKDVGAPGAISFLAVFSCSWPALLLATICLLPFLNKPFVVDDPHFLMMARQIVEHPTHPMDFMECWNISLDCTKAYVLTPGNTLMGYVLVPTVLTGTHEWTAHLTQLVLVWVAVLAMACLVLRYGWDRRHAIVGALLLVAIAPFMPMASTAMPDILATAVALVAMERLAAWKAEQKWSQGISAAIALGLAGVARAHLPLLLPLAAFYLFDTANPKEFLPQFRRRPWLWAPVLIGAAILATTIAITREHNLAINPPHVYTGLRNIRPNLIAYLLYLVFPIPLAFCWLANRLKTRLLRAVIILVLVAIASWFIYPRRLSIFAALGCAVLADMLFEEFKKLDHTGLFLILWILIPLPIAYYGHLPAKYLLPCMPAIIFLCFRLIEPFSARFAQVVAVALITAGTGYSLLILRSDAEMARFGRDAIYQLIQPRVAAGETVWYHGQIAAYWYAPLAGASHTYTGGPQPRPGDLLVVGLYEGAREWELPLFPHRSLVESVTHIYRFGRTMGAGMGLYSNLFGDWMWGFGSGPDDEYQLWRIE